MTTFSLSVLGCGSAKLTTRHRPSCQVLDVRGQLMMIDCGEGAQLGAQLGRVRLSRLRHIFISHLHGDHVFGLPGLISTLALSGHSGKVTVHTFADGVEWLQRTIDFFCGDRPFELEYNVLAGTRGVVYENDYLTVSTFPLNHRVPCVGYRFEVVPRLRHIIPEAIERYGVPRHAINSLRMGGDWTMPDGTVVPSEMLTTPPTPGRSYAYCSDTAPGRRVVDAIEGVDWLYHEATYGESRSRDARNRGHSTARQAATAALEAGAKNLIIGHFSSRYTPETEQSQLLAEAREVFPNTILAHEELTVDINSDLSPVVNG